MSTTRKVQVSTYGDAYYRNPGQLRFKMYQEGLSIHPCLYLSLPQHLYLDLDIYIYVYTNAPTDTLWLGSQIPAWGSRTLRPIPPGLAVNLHGLETLEDAVQRLPNVKGFWIQPHRFWCLSLWPKVRADEYQGILDRTFKLDPN